MYDDTLKSVPFQKTVTEESNCMLSESFPTLSESKCVLSESFLTLSESKCILSESMHSRRQLARYTLCTLTP